ncbi:MAG: hypothetical protein ACOVOQ_09405 [Flavobacterium sp.]|nr:hypothetical protein [Flavobacterium sp.]
MKMKLNKQLFLTNDTLSSDWINLSEFDILSDINNFNLLDFFNSKYYTNEFLNLKIKENKEIDFPKPLFVGCNIEISKLKVYNRNELDSFLLNYTSDVSFWGEIFHNNFIQLYKKLKPHLDTLSQCYLLDKEEFDIESSIVTDSFLYYDYYLLFIWIDIDRMKFYTCEWACD